MKPQKPLRYYLVYTLFFCMLQTKSMIFAKQNNSISSVFVFGDSTVDPGNNNYIGTVFKSNIPPYGRDFPNQVPTGRFTNGRLVTDYLVSYLGIKQFLPPYLDSTLDMKDLMTGVSFASAGSGLDPLTPTLTGVIPIPVQLEYFREYKRKLETKLGKGRSLNIIRKAVFIISAGTNDFSISYFSTRIRQHAYTVASYRDFLLQELLQLTKGLEAEGARMIGVVGLPPIGCLPALITLNSNDSLHENGRGCIESFSAAAKDYNLFLQKQLSAMQNYGSKVTYVYIDIYTPLNNIIQQPNFGFDVVNKGCCGSGLIETTVFLCNPKTPVCPDASKYVFWDSVHPTQMAYNAIFKSMIPTINRYLKFY